MAFAVSREDYEEKPCIWSGCSCLGTWHHIAWECSCRPHGAPPTPTDPFQARLGWPQTTVDERTNLKVLAWLEDIADRMNHQRTDGKYVKTKSDGAALLQEEDGGGENSPAEEVDDWLEQEDTEDEEAET